MQNMDCREGAPSTKHAVQPRTLDMFGRNCENPFPSNRRMLKTTGEWVKNETGLMEPWVHSPMAVTSAPYFDMKSLFCCCPVCSPNGPQQPNAKDGGHYVLEADLMKTMLDTAPPRAQFPFLSLNKSSLSRMAEQAQCPAAQQWPREVLPMKPFTVSTLRRASFITTQTRVRKQAWFAVTLTGTERFPVVDMGLHEQIEHH
ncbi:hypothetical protein JZ751_016863 [Albula glossodonta]|uniref:Uncharacterized protein n=1 Tax=Albula glossodonta TaxID=121402 RepID=A0A8T2NTD8_9TELE|nr:hypothetical protein JZ751_016863 [Albula glossodonta]